MSGTCPFCGGPQTEPEDGWVLCVQCWSPQREDGGPFPEEKAEIYLTFQTKEEE